MGGRLEMSLQSEKPLLIIEIDFFSISWTFFFYLRCPAEYFLAELHVNPTASDLLEEPGKRELN